MAEVEGVCDADERQPRRKQQPHHLPCKVRGRRDRQGDGCPRDRGCEQRRKLAVAIAHGADDGVNYAEEDLKSRVADLTGGDGVDVVFDPVGGDLFDPALSSLGWGGRYLIFGFVGGVPKIPANRLLVKHRSAMGCSLRYFTDKAPDKLATSMDELFAMYAAGKIKPLVSETYPLEQAVEAMARLHQRKATGRVVVTVG